MEDVEGRMVEREDEVLERRWEELGRRSKDRSEDDVVPDTEMGDVGGCVLGMCKRSKLGRSGGLEELEERDGSRP